MTARRHIELAAPGHKTARGLVCECGRALSSERALYVHQLKPWLTDAEVTAWNGDPNA